MKYRICMYKCILLSTVLVFSSCGNNSEYKTKVQDAEVLHRAMKAITDRIVHDILSPPVASRIYAYASVAGYEAIIHQDKNYLSLAGQLHGLEKFPQPDTTLEHCYPLAAMEAIFKVGRTFIFSEKEFDEIYEKELQKMKETGMPIPVFERSIAFGDSVAKHVIKWSSKDNYKQSRTFPKYTVEKNPATWQPTPPGYMDAVEPHWNTIRTFVIDSAQQFKPMRPTIFSKDKGGSFYKDALVVYETGKSLTDEQRAIASFWDCNPFVINVRGHVQFATKKISPGGHWINITRLACENTHADMVKSAEAYVCVALSLADAFISCWDEKYRSKVIRPETFINQYIDESWVPLLQTPPFPEYPSGHSVISTAAATVLTKLFGDNYSFTDSTEVEFGMAPRSFKSFIEASQEAAQSRVYGGIHYMPAVENGKLQGKQVGELILSRVVTRRKEAATKSGLGPAI